MTLEQWQAGVSRPMGTAIEVHTWAAMRPKWEKRRIGDGITLSGHPDHIDSIREIHIKIRR